MPPIDIGRSAVQTFPKGIGLFGNIVTLESEAWLLPTARPNLSIDILDVETVPTGLPLNSRGPWLMTRSATFACTLTTFRDIGTLNEPKCPEREVLISVLYRIVDPAVNLIRNW